MKTTLARLMAFWGLVLILAWIPGAAPAAGSTREPWNLALVVDLSGAEDLVWGDTTLIKALERVLEVEIKSLPMRVTAALWFQGKGGARALLRPTSAGGLREWKLSFDSGPQPVEPGTAMDGALAWLSRSGKGSLVLLAPPGETSSRVDVSWPQMSIYGHVLTLGEPVKNSGCPARKWGGVCLSASKVEQLPRMLHRLVRNALSTAFLLVVAHDRKNKPLAVDYDLERRGGGELLAGLSGKTTQLLPGVYSFRWPVEHGIGPGRPPREVSVRPEGVTDVFCGGQGSLGISARDGEGKNLPWSVRVVRSPDGELMESWRVTPFERQLPSGEYLISTRKPRLSRRVVITAGGEVNLVMGPAARFLAQVKGSGGVLLRLPLVLEAQGGELGMISGHTGQEMLPNPGRYRMVLETIPPVIRLLDLEPARQVTIQLPDMGALMAKPAATGSERRYWVFDKEGKKLGQGLEGRALPLGAGEYRLRVAGLDHLVEFSVEPGETVLLTLP